MNDTDAMALFSTLSQKTRLKMLRALVAAGSGGMTAGRIAEAVDASPSRASFHLANMTETGLVAAEKASREVRYRVRFETLGALMTYLLEDCCAGDPTFRACCPPTS